MRPRTPRSRSGGSQLLLFPTSNQPVFRIQILFVFLFFLFFLFFFYLYPFSLLSLCGQYGFRKKKKKPVAYGSPLICDFELKFKYLLAQSTGSIGYSLFEITVAILIFNMLLSQRCGSQSESNLVLLCDFYLPISSVVNLLFERGLTTYLLKIN